MDNLEPIHFLYLGIAVLLLLIPIVWCYNRKVATKDPETKHDPKPVEEEKPIEEAPEVQVPDTDTVVNMYMDDLVQTSYRTRSKTRVSIDLEHLKRIQPEHPFLKYFGED